MALVSQLRVLLLISGNGMEMWPGPAQSLFCTLRTKFGSRKVAASSLSPHSNTKFIVLELQNVFFLMWEFHPKIQISKFNDFQHDDLTNISNIPE